MIASQKCINSLQHCMTFCNKQSTKGEGDVTVFGIDGKWKFLDFSAASLACTGKFG